MQSKTFPNTVVTLQVLMGQVWLKWRTFWFSQNLLLTHLGVNKRCSISKSANGWNLFVDTNETLFFTRQTLNEENICFVQQGIKIYTSKTQKSRILPEMNTRRWTIEWLCDKKEMSNISEIHSSFTVYLDKNRWNIHFSQ